MMRLALLLGGILAAGLSLLHPAAAHTRSETHSAWQIAGNTVRLQFTVPDLEARRITAGGELPSVEELGAYIAAHVGASAGAAECARSEGPRPLSSTPGYRRYEFAFACPGEEDISVRSSAWFDLVESHTNFAQVQNDKGVFVEQLITKDRQTLDLESAGGGALQDAGFLEFVRMGVMHIFTGIDHMSFMLGFVLISRRLRDLLFAVTGFTIGHSLTLGLAVTGILRPEAQYIDALVALTIALIGAENIGDSTHRPLAPALGLGGILIAFALAKNFGAPVTLPAMILVGGGLFAASYMMMTGHMRDAGRVRLIVTLVFGLIHGFGFASNLLDERLPRDRLAELLVGFNVGVEIGQVTVVLVAVLLARLLVRLRLAMPRPLFTDLAASFLVGEGLFWFVGRTLGAG
jgi:hypothetical protein